MLSATTQEIAGLRLRVKAPRLSAVERACTHCTLASLDGDQSESRRILGDWIVKLGDQENHCAEAHFLANAAILVGELDLARHFISAHIRPGFEFSLSVDEEEPRPAGAVSWTITDSNVAQFAFNPEIFRSLKGESPISRWLSTLPLFAHCMRSGEIQTGRINVGLEDRGIQDGLAYCDNRPHIFLIPDPVFIRTDSYADTRQSFSRHHVPWERRRPIAFWRGATTGRPEPRELGWRALPRVKLCEIGRKYPELIDAALTSIVQISDEKSREELASSGLLARHRPIKDILSYRYQIDIDGNSNSWPGLFQKFLSGGPVLKVTSPYGFEQWYYDRFKPWIHFVPVASGLEDLAEKVEWLRANDAQARMIGERARALAGSMDCEAELQRSVRTIRAAFRESMKLPELSLAFGTGAPGNACLGTGWELEGESAGTIGRVSSMEIPAPAAKGRYVIEFDMSPCTTAPTEFTIAVNGKCGKPRSIDSRQTIRQEVSLHNCSDEDRVSITLLNPAESLAASASRPLDERLVGARLHAIQVSRCASPESNAFGSRAPHILIRAREDSVQAAVMQRLHQKDVWRGFVPAGPGENIVQGWNGSYGPFRAFLTQAPNKTFVDVGVWKGQSTIFVAEFMRQTGMDGCVISVDTFLGSPEHYSGKELFQRIHGRPDLYDSFLDNVYYKQLTHLVVPFPQTSVTAAVLLQRRGIKAGIVHIDASHEYEQCLRDAELYWPLIVPGGYLIGDDYHESWPGVVRAAKEFAAAQGLELTIQMPKWIVRKL